MLVIVAIITEDSVSDKWEYINKRVFKTFHPFNGYFNTFKKAYSLLQSTYFMYYLN